MAKKKKKAVKKRKIKKRVVKRKSRAKKKVVKRKPKKVKIVKTKKPIKRIPLSQGFFMFGLLGLIVALWWTYFGFEGKKLALEWGATFIIFFIIVIIASFRSLEIS